MRRSCGSGELHFVAQARADGPGVGGGERCAASRPAAANATSRGARAGAIPSGKAWFGEALTCGAVSSLRGTNSPRSRSRDPTAHEQRRCRRARAAPWMPVMSKRDRRSQADPGRAAEKRDARERAKSTLDRAGFGLPSVGRRAVHERAPAHLLPPAAGLEGGDHPPDAQNSRACTRTRPSTPTSPTAPPPRPTARSSCARDHQRKLVAKIDGARPHRGRHVRLLRGDGRADRPQAARRTPDRHPLARAQERHERRERVHREE